MLKNTSMLAAMLALSCATAGPRAPLTLPPGDGCVAALDTAWGGWSFEVGPGQVRGSGLELRSEGEVLIGFLAGRNTRVHVTDDRLFGTVAGYQADLKIAREHEALVLRGTLGSLGQVVMRSHPDRIDFFSDQISVELSRGHRGFAGSAKRFSDISRSTLETRGCEAMFAEPAFLLAVMAPFLSG